MTNWSSLKVVDLRAELSSRGLPQKGVKAELIQRLNEADADAAHPVAPATGDDGPNEETDRSADDATVPREASAELMAIDSAPSTDATATSTVDEGAPKTAEPVPAPEVHATETKDARPETNDQPRLPTPVLSSDAAPEAQKRKRRTSTPPPSAKRARQEEERQAEQHEDVVDFDTGDLSSSPHKTPQNGVAKSEGLTDVTERDQLELTRDEAYAEQAAKADSSQREPLPPTTQAPDSSLEIRGDEAYAKRAATANSTTAMLSNSTGEVQAAPLGISGDEAFLKRVAIGKPSDAPQNTSDPEHEPRQASRAESSQPAGAPTGEEVPGSTDGVEFLASTHPPTTSLYLRELMRPLRSEMVEQYIIDLITPSGSEPDPSLIEDFYLDQIRTHAFVQLKSVAAAQRVRAALHNQVWPNERNRKPLWVDFIPSSQVKHWIEQEESGSRDRKRWEVVYEQDGESVVAIHQEAGSDSKPFSKPPPTGPAAGPVYPGIEAAPRGPRGRGGRAPFDNPSGIQTRAQPSIFYTPLSEDVARRRVDNMRSFYGRDPPPDLGKDYHRYTFESTDSFVDRGREVFIGIRPPHRQKEHEERLQRERLGTTGTGSVGGSRRDDHRAPPRPPVNDDSRFPRYEGGRRPDWPPRHRGFRSDRGSGRFREDPYRYRPGY